MEDPSLYARTEIIPARFGNGEMLLRVLHRYVVMALPLVYVKSRKRVLTSSPPGLYQDMVADTGERGLRSVPS